ncbi:MAG: hypothetical protein M3285_12105, partial [Actinomycetota bacterium]|nr:hypothetical protein [Actinomycetota bacterium]
MFSAHPLTEVQDLGVSPLVLIVAGSCVIIAAAELARRAGRAGEPTAGADPRFTPLRPATVVLRIASVAVLALCIVAGRLGVESQLDNIAPALVVGLLWPLLPLLSVVVGNAWAHVDPYDTLARLTVPDPATEEAEARRGSVYPAIAVVIAWTWYLGAWRSPLDPRSVGSALAVYTIVILAGCLWVGRRQCLARVELFGLMCGWAGRMTKGGLGSWAPPKGTDLVMGALIGGLLFYELRSSTLWGELNISPHALLWATLGVVACCLVGAVLMRAGGFLSGSIGAGAAVAVPLALGVILALAMSRNRLFTSLQLLPGLVADPLGFNWVHAGPDLADLDPEPLGHIGLA